MLRSYLSNVTQLISIYFLFCLAMVVNYITRIGIVCVGALKGFIDYFQKVYDFNCLILLACEECLRDFQLKFL